MRLIHIPANRIKPKHITTSPRAKFDPEASHGPTRINRHEGWSRA